MHMVCMVKATGNVGQEVNKFFGSLKRGFWSGYNSRQEIILSKTTFICAPDGEVTPDEHIKTLTFDGRLIEQINFDE